MGYSEDPSVVRVDFFKPSGQWYTTEAVRCVEYRGDIIDAFERSLELHLKKHSFDGPCCKHCGTKGGGDVNDASHCSKAPFRLAGMTAVCLEPHHEHAHPLMVRVPGEY